MAADKDFLGKGWSFPPSFNINGKSTAMLSADDDIKQSLYILLSTAPGERVMRPNFGCGINKMMFDSLNNTSISQMKDLIKMSVLKYEPRVDLIDISVEKVIEEGYVNFNLEYIITSVNTRSNMVFPFYLVEGTQLRKPNQD